MARDNHQALLDGARVCLDRQGYARTRARDVAQAAGVSLAAIGYHFGSTDALLVRTLVDGMQEWAALVDERTSAVGAGDDVATVARRWDAMTASLPGYRGVLAASFELIARADAAPEVAEQLRTALHEARRRIAEHTHGVDATADPDRAARVGAAGYAVVSGVIVQWLVDPDAIPSGSELAEGLREVAGL